MALNPTETFRSATPVTRSIAADPKDVRVGTLKDAEINGVKDLPVLTPLAFRTSASAWVVWTPGTAPEYKFGPDETNGAPTGGTFTFSINGQVTGAIAYNATVPVFQAAIDAAVGAGNVIVSVDVDGPTIDLANLILTFVGKYLGLSMTLVVDDALLTGGTGGNGTFVMVGADGAETQDVIAGFLWEPATTNATQEVLCQVMLQGKLAFSHIPESMYDAGNTVLLYDKNALIEACKNGPRTKGLIVQGVPAVR